MHLKKARHDYIPRTYITTDTDEEYVLIDKTWYTIYGETLESEYAREAMLNRALREYYESIRD